jgi:hypothetical protein
VIRRRLVHYQFIAMMKKRMLKLLFELMKNLKRSDRAYTTPDTKVGSEDMDTIAGVWFQAPPWNRLECDMQPYDHFIDVYDAARVGMDWGKTAVPQ